MPHIERGVTEKRPHLLISRGPDGICSQPYVGVHLGGFQRKEALGPLTLTVELDKRDSDPRYHGNCIRVWVEVEDMPK